MRKTFDEITAETHARMRRDSLVIQRMIAVNAYYNGDIVVPLRIPGEPDMKAPMPNIVADAIDNQSMRANTVPFLTWVPHLHDSDLSRKRAEITRRSIKAIRHHSGGERLTARWYRHGFAYGSMAGVVREDRKEMHAKLEVRDVLRSYAEHRTPEDLREPLNAAFVYSRSAQWLRQEFGHVPGVTDLVRPSQGAEPTDLWDLVEWIDEHDTVTGIIGKRWTHAQDPIRSPEVYGQRTIELSREPTKCNGFVPVSVPWRVTLDRIAGVVGSLLDNVNWIMHLRAMEVVAAKASVQPEIVVLGDTGEDEPRLVSGEWQPGTTGKPNIVQGARNVMLLSRNPQQYTGNLVQQLLEDVNETSGNLAQYRGETRGAMRTGRAFDSLMAAASDPKLQEAQEIMGAHLTVLETAALEMEKACWPQKKYFCLTGSHGRAGSVEYTPADDWETSLHDTYCPAPGLDATQLATILPTKRAAGLLSTRSAMELDPHIDDPEAEMDQIRYEQLEGLVFASVQQELGTGAVTLPDIAEFAKTLHSGKKNPWEAVEIMQAAAQARQATAVPEGDPASMPGAAVPGQGAEQPVEPEPPMPMGGQERQASVSQLLGALRSAPTAPTNTSSVAARSGGTAVQSSYRP